MWIQNPIKWRQAHQVLFEYFQTIPKKDESYTFQKLEPLCQAVYHGCRAGYYESAFKVYNEKIQGKKASSFYNLGASGAFLSALSGFFEQLWDKPVSVLNEETQNSILSRAGLILWAHGRLQEAIKSRNKAFEKHSALKQHNAPKWTEAARDAINLSQYHLAIGNVSTSHRIGLIKVWNLLTKVVKII